MFQAEYDALPVSSTVRFPQPVRALSRLSALFLLMLGSSSSLQGIGHACGRVDLSGLRI